LTCLFTAVALAYLSWCGTVLSDTSEQRAAIVKAAREAHIDPSTALAIAQRESDFNPQAKSSKTIRGIFQMRGDLRDKYGIGDSTDPYAQAKGWTSFFNDTKARMSSLSGREVTDAEGYAGHHFGADRAARMLSMDPSTPVSQVFTPYERSINPHFDRAGTVGNLMASTTADIDQRRAKFGGTGDQSASLDTSGFEPVEGAAPSKSATNDLDHASLDLSSFEPVAPQTASAEPALDTSQFEAV
jgi:hypothetical protein